MTAQGSAFPNYMQIPTHVPRWVWDLSRVASVSGLVALIVVLIVSPRQGLTIWWGIAVPLLPLVWLLMAGLWRNICPLAAVNQVPRRSGLSLSRSAPAKWTKYAPALGMTAFLIMVASRPLLFDHSGVATAAALGAALCGALLGGVLLKGKSGWCSSVCPLLPVQRLYGQAPLTVVPNAHCQPCVGCTKNCYDFNPKIAWLADVHDTDARWSGLRILFAGAFPGVVVAYFTTPSGASAAEVCARFLITLAASIGIYVALRTLLGASDLKMTAVFAAAAISLFYWWASEVLARSIFGNPDHWTTWVLRAGVIVCALAFIRRSFRTEATFLKEREAPDGDASIVRFGGASSLNAIRDSRQGSVEVMIEPDSARILTKPNTPLLEVAEGAGLTIEAGCRMGVCGADPVCIVKGLENLSAPTREETATLDRLGLSDNMRMACSARVRGPVTMNLKPEKADAPRTARIEGFAYDTSVDKVVVLGNGIAGVTTADHLRRRHPECSIEIVAAEPYPLYNRMGISRIIYGRSAMAGLTLLPDSWYDSNEITAWLNTRAVAIDRNGRQVLLGTGETLAYDRLVIATGARSFIPPLEGFGKDGTFALRSAGDAFSIREYSQRNGCNRAAVAGGGLLGLEAAVALSKIGLQVTVLDRNNWLLSRQLDRRGAQLLQGYLEGLGLTVLLNASCTQLRGDGKLEEITLGDGRTVEAEMALVAAGIVPDIELAQEAGLETARGIVVDDLMRTSDPLIYAVGDTAEHGGRVLGLWPTAVEQAEVAGEAIAGGTRTFKGTVPVTLLKVAGIDVLSCGRIEESGQEGEEVIIHDDRTGKRYTKLLVVDGHLVGAIVVGHSVEGAGELSAAVKEHRQVGARIERLRAGDLDLT
ncbi:FAD-dependent oxidoreductase [Streptomyces sp. NPDC127178]|uniref:FAD-dependent oxidoreductase n=1 Tax=unclassified Streptomyces TaxID=2593676 RepID=UPI003633A0E3